MKIFVWTIYCLLLLAPLLWVLFGPLGGRKDKLNLPPSFNKKDKRPVLKVVPNDEKPLPKVVPNDDEAHKDENKVSDLNSYRKATDRKTLGPAQTSRLSFHNQILREKWKRKNQRPPQG